MLPNYSRVRLITTRFQSENLNNGDIGYIIEVYQDAYEVEFSDQNGISIGQIVAKKDDIELY